MKRTKILLPLLILGVLIGSSSCKKNRDAKAVITVLKDSVNFITGDTVQVAAVQAIVRFYLDQIGAEQIDTTIRTNTSGKAEFVWFEDAIIQYDVVYNSFTDLENYIILKQGETVEKTVIVP
ncbi:MAG: hypothetical protein K9J17_00875 [Flavobacteriales bacterium]|nr:hypothetical protein [Flavobacteriales bacterium]